MAATFRHHLLRLFTENPGKVLYADDLAAKLNVPRKSIISCVYNMRRTTKVLNEQIEVVVYGNAWRYNGQPGVPIGTPQPLNGIPIATDRSDASAAPVAPATRPANEPVQPKPSQPAEPIRDRSPRVFEEIGTNDEGRVLVADEHGTIYWLVPTKRNNNNNNA